MVQAGCGIGRLEGIYLKPFTTRQIVSQQLDQKIVDTMCEIGLFYPELSFVILAEISAR